MLDLCTGSGIRQVRRRAQLRSDGLRMVQDPGHHYRGRSQSPAVTPIYVVTQRLLFEEVRNLLAGLFNLLAGLLN